MATFHHFKGHFFFITGLYREVIICMQDWQSQNGILHPIQIVDCHVPVFRLHL